MQGKKITIAILLTTALALAAANWMIPTSAEAQVSVKERDYQAVTARIQTGGDALYILDNRRSLIVVLTYDPGTRTVVPRQVRDIAEAFIPR